MGETITPMRGTVTDPALTGAATLEDQLADFFAAHYERMVRLAGLVCRGGGLAEDRIVVREAIRMNRRSWWSRLTSTYAEEHAPVLPDPAGDTTPERLALAAAFDALAPEQRAACVLHLQLGYGVAETAALMGAGVETTRSRLRLARQRLRADLSEEDR